MPDSYLRFWAERSLSDDEREALRALIESAPEPEQAFVRSDDGATGLSLTVHDSRRERVDPQVDRAEYELAMRTAAALQAFSRSHDVVFEVEYLGELVGAIEAGAMDRSLREGLFEPWDKGSQGFA